MLQELRTIGIGHPEDAFIIDDAQLFASAPPPHRPEQWPELTEVFDLLRELHPEHVVTLLEDQVVAVPRRAKPAVDAYGLRLQLSGGFGQRMMPYLLAARDRLRR